MSTKIPSLELTSRFINGLKKYNLTYDEIKKSGFKYCGGDKSKRHLNYFKLFFKTEDLPVKVDKCVCGHNIKENCYISNENQLLILGNCCIKKFVEKCYRTCNVCEEKHQNRVVNRCKNCRKGICDICDKICDKKYKKCNNCKKR